MSYGDVPNSAGESFFAAGAGCLLVLAWFAFAGLIFWGIGALLKMAGAM
ncbi:MAG: hypothetical protein AABN33_18190 [Acidobacteriota bacterium]